MQRPRHLEWIVEMGNILVLTTCERSRHQDGCMITCKDKNTLH